MTSKCFFFSSRRRHTRWNCDWSSDVCSSDLARCLVANCDRRHYGHKLWRVVRHELRRFLFDLTDTLADILVVHDGMVPHLMRAGVPRQRLRVLRNPVLPWRSSRVQAEGNRDVFYVGRVEADKGVDLLARAARRAGAHL